MLTERTLQIEIEIESQYIVLVTKLFIIIETPAASFAYDMYIKIALAIECQLSTTI